MKKINHIAILLDRSTSIRGIAPGIIKQFNAQANQINERSKQEGQKTHLSLYTFSTVADRPLLFEVPLDFVAIRNITEKDYTIEGSTALLDSVGMAIEDLSEFHKNLSKQEDHSFLIIVLTDGQENMSVKYPRQHPEKLEQLMRDRMNSDMWTFVFLVPKGDKQNLVQNFKIPEGNVEEWDPRCKTGVEEIGKKTAVGLDNFFVGRSKGIRSTRSFFTDLSKVSGADVKKLTEVTSWYNKVVVSARDITGTDQYGNDTAVIAKFCEKHFGHYIIGHAFYELHKKEKIQDNKDVIVEEIKTGRMYGGEDGRRLLGLPEFGQVTVQPGDHGKFRVYVKSNSTNRKLVKGTHLLYKRR